VAPKVFRDPIHGNIEVDESELRIIDLPQFQRLRHIHQLALTHFVFHGAEHTRFGHSLGVLEVAGRMFDRLRTPGGGLEGMPQDKARRKRRLVRLAALVHDIGHSPFSHALEGGDEKLFARGEDHDKVGARIIGEQLTSAIKDAYAGEISAEDVVEVLEHALPAEETYLWQIISGPLDADKIDYLLRDAHYCGVRYGWFDFERILSKLIVHELPPEYGVSARVLGLDKGATEAYEEFFLARHWMNAQVYMHPARRQLDIIIRKLVVDLVPGGQLPTDITQYLRWDDDRVFAEAATSSSPWAQRLFRPLFYCAWRERVTKQRVTKVTATDSKSSAQSGVPVLQQFHQIADALEADASLKGSVYRDLATIKNKDYAERPGDASQKEADQIPFFVRREKDAKLVPVAQDSAVIPSVPETMTYFFVFVDRAKQERAMEIVSSLNFQTESGSDG